MKKGIATQSNASPNASPGAAIGPRVPSFPRVSRALSVRRAGPPSGIVSASSRRPPRGRCLPPSSSATHPPSLRGRVSLRRGLSPRQTSAGGQLGRRGQHVSRPTRRRAPSSRLSRCNLESGRQVRWCDDCALRDASVRGAVSFGTGLGLGRAARCYAVRCSLAGACARQDERMCRGACEVHVCITAYRFRLQITPHIYDLACGPWLFRLSSALCVPSRSSVSFVHRDVSSRL